MTENSIFDHGMEKFLNLAKSGLPIEKGGRFILVSSRSIIAK